MARRSRARFLAPIALIAVIAGTYAIVHAGLNPKADTPTRATSTTGTTKAQTTAHRKFAKARFYVVQQGDSLTSIAARTGVSLTAIEALNPNVDPNALQTGQRLRLRR
jgi:LysM repeat protein